MRKGRKQILARTFDLEQGGCHGRELEHNQIFSCFHSRLLLSHQAPAYRLPSSDNELVPKWSGLFWHYTSIPQPRFSSKINYSGSLQSQSEFSHQKGNFHSLCLSLVQEGKTKRGKQEGAMLTLLENGHMFPPLGRNPERWNVTEPSMQSSRSRVRASWEQPNESDSSPISEVPQGALTKTSDWQGERGRLSLQELKSSHS